jgi:hypothetical protein
LFARGFKAKMQPLELGKKLIKEMDAQKTVSIGKVYVPNEYKISLSMQDLKTVKSYESALIADLADYLVSHARQQKYTIIGAPKIQIEGDEHLSLGEIKISSSLTATEDDAEPKDQTQIILPDEMKEGITLGRRAFLILRSSSDNLTFPLLKKTTVLGRLHTNDIVLEDPNVSRVHAEIKLESEGYTVYDLGSTNGIFVNGKKQKKWVLHEGDVIAMGETEFLYKE